MKILKNIKLSLSQLKKSELKKYFFNTFWFLSGKAYYLLISGLISILMARYLKPDNYGVISYAFSLMAILSPLVTLGVEQIVIRDLINSDKNENHILGSAFWLKLFGGVAAFLVLNLINQIFHHDQSTRIIVFVMSFISLFRSFDVINFYLQAKVKAKQFILIESMATTIILFLKVIFIILQKNIYFFAAAYLLETIIIALGLIYVYRIILKRKFSDWKFDPSFSKKLLKDSSPLIISSIMVTLYMKIDQVIIKNMIGNGPNGLYAVAVKLSEMWYFIPAAFVGATFPSLLSSFKNNLIKFNLRLKQLNNLLIIFSLAMGLLVNVFGEQIITFLYGDAYLQSVAVFKIYIWATIPVCLGLTASKWIVAKNLQKYNIYSTSIGSISNILLNFILIPRYGIIGSAWATLISYSLSGVIVYGFFEETRELFLLTLQSFKQPFYRNS